MADPRPEGSRFDDNESTSMSPRRTTTSTRHRSAERRRADRGATFIELLVAIVLLGTAIIGTLTALRATIIGTTVSRDQSKAQQWLQSAAGVIEGEDYSDCTASLDENTVKSDYQTAIDAEATAPFDFTPQHQINVADIDVWDGTRFVDFASQSLCYDQFLLRQQLVTVEVVDSAGKMLEQLQLVKQGHP